MWGLVFVINFGKTSVIITLCISSVSLFLSPPSSVATTQMSHIPFVIQKGAIPSQREKTIVLGYSPVFFVLFLFFFFAFRLIVLSTIFQVPWCFFLSHVQSPGASIKDFLHFSFLFPVFVFDSFLEFTSLYLHLPAYSCLLFTFSFVDLTILIIVILNYLHDNSRMWAVSDSESDAWSVSAHCVSCLLLYLLIFCSKSDITYWVRGTGVSRSFVWGFVFFWPRLRLLLSGGAVGIRSQMSCGVLVFISLVVLNECLRYAGLCVVILCYYTGALLMWS